MTKDDQVQFQEQGYLLLEGFFPEDVCRNLRQAAEEIGEESRRILGEARARGIPMEEIPKHIPGIMVVPEAADPTQVCRVEDMLSHRPDLLRFVNEMILPLIGDLQGEPYVSFKDKLNFKWPGGGAFPPHQDFPAYAGFGPREHVTAMVSIDPATHENGCLQVARNYKEALRGRESIDPSSLDIGHAIIPCEGDVMDAEIIAALDWIPLQTKPADLVLFDSYVPHRSEPNRSDHPRRAMFLTNNRLVEGEWREAYYDLKRRDPANPQFHFATPTKKAQ